MIRFFRSRWTLAASAIVLAGVGFLLFGSKADANEDSLVAHAVRGDFKVLVTTAGDLRAKNSVSIAPPQNTCMVGACTMKINSIIPEGSVVNKGDTVAELDRSPITTFATNTNLAMQKARAVFEQAQLDTTLNLSKAREELRLATTALEERTIAKEQAKYEAPSTRRQADLDYSKAERALAQGKIDYVTRENQAKAKMREVSTDLQRNDNQLKMIQDVVSSFTVTAPAPGMLIYSRDYNGKKRAAGTMVYSGEGAIALLPDLSHMESMTYVNEVDVRKVNVGQPVSLTLDSDPTKHLSGKIVGVANVGEERPNSDAKVFEVKIEVIESDTTLRPGMTTGNAIEVLGLKNVLSVPLEAVASDGSVQYVFKKSGKGIVKQEVETGALNDTHIVIVKGLDEGDAVLLIPPVNQGQLALNRLPGDPNATSPKGSDAPATKSVPMAPKSKATPAPVPAPAKASGAPTSPVKPSGKP